MAASDYKVGVPLQSSSFIKSVEVSADGFKKCLVKKTMILHP